MIRLAAVAVVVAGCHAATPARPFAPEHAVKQIAIDAQVLAAELRSDGDALASRYVRGSFAFNHREATPLVLSGDEAFDTAHKLGQMLVHPSRTALTCLARNDGGAVCSQLGGLLVTLVFAHDDSGLVLEHAFISARRKPEARESIYDAKPLTQPPQILFP